MSDSRQSLVIERAEQLWEPANRRKFLKLLGIGGSVVLMPTVFTGCDALDDLTGTTPGVPSALDLSTDVGILNYAYALEQLEAGFYTAVVGLAGFGSFTAEQQEVFTDLRNHEVIHREFLRAALGGNAIPALAFNTTTVATLTANLTSILRAAEGFEDLGVAAYNGAGKYFASANNLTLAGKIVSVEARHAAAIRDMRDALGVTAGAAANTRFAGDDVVLTSGAFQGLDVKLEPSAVIARVNATTVASTTLGIGTPPPVKNPTTDNGPPNPTP